MNFWYTTILLVQKHIIHISLYRFQHHFKHSLLLLICIPPPLLYKYNYVHDINFLFTAISRFYRMWLITIDFINFNDKMSSAAYLYSLNPYYYFEYHCSASMQSISTSCRDATECHCSYLFQFFLTYHLIPWSLLRYLGLIACHLFKSHWTNFDHTLSTPFLDTISTHAATLNTILSTFMKSIFTMLLCIGTTAYHYSYLV